MKIKTARFVEDVTFLGHLIKRTISPDRDFALSGPVNGFLMVELLRDPGMGRVFAIPMARVEWLEVDAVKDEQAPPVAMKKAIGR